MKTLAIAFWSVVLLLFLGAITLNIVGLFQHNEYTLTVTEKVVKNSKDRSKYLIFTKDEEDRVKVIQNTDSLLKGKFNSSDIYADLKVGKTYDFDVYGFRIPFFSKYENIESYKEVK